ncbi:ribonuclease HII [Candidatus Kaiserbacteria bacterium]|nr:ribonuclease HII [Candidatus Kaiserbacteria bacterium]
MRYLVGIDEAGRGALAGPVCVGAVLYPEDFDWREAFALVTRPNRAGPGSPRLRDSKQLSAQQREILFDYIVDHGRLKHAFALVDAAIIDAIGITHAAREAAALALSRLSVTPSRVHVLLDAGLSVPDHWSQESIVRGDEQIPAIAFASIVAKVTRDRFMEDLDGPYEPYNFAQHKGYGTQAHVRAIRGNGLTDLHRASFCKGLILR